MSPDLISGRFPPSCSGTLARCLQKLWTSFYAELPLQRQNSCVSFTPCMSSKKGSWCEDDQLSSLTTNHPMLLISNKEDLSHKHLSKFWQQKHRGEDQEKKNWARLSLVPCASCENTLQKQCWGVEEGDGIGGLPRALEEQDRKEIFMESLIDGGEGTVCPRRGRICRKVEIWKGRQCMQFITGDAV